MTSKRKRVRPSKSNAEEPRKKARRGGPEQLTVERTNHPTLRLYYKQISTLREHLLSQLPKSSKKRRCKIALLGETASVHKDQQIKELLVDDVEVALKDLKPDVDDDKEGYLASLLDETLVCSVGTKPNRDDARHAKDFEAFSLQVSLTAGSSNGQGSSSQSELIDFAIWSLFHRVHRQSNRPPHMLCHGYQRARGPQKLGDDSCAVAGIPGIVSHYPNSNVSSLKGAEWNDVLNLLGRDGEQIMLNMIMHCGIFVKIESGRGNYSHLSGMFAPGSFQNCSYKDLGIPLTDLQVLAPDKNTNEIELKGLTIADGAKAPKVVTGTPEHARSPASITFVRNRIFYARAALNAKGKVTFGLRHIRQYRQSNRLGVVLRPRRRSESIS